MKPAVLKKWIPAVLAPAVIAAFAVGASLSANAQVQLEPKTPQQVLQMIADSDVTDFSGNARATLDLGIPQLPDPGNTGTTQQPATPGTEGESESGDASATDGANLLGMLSSLSGTHEAAVYVDGPDKARIQVLDGMNEQNFIRNGSSLWHYDSAEQTAVHTTLPATTRQAGPRRDTKQPLTPGDMADRLIGAMEPNTRMSVLNGTRVAGRDAYTLELVPRSGDSLIAKVSIGVDAATGAPLEVVVDAVGQEAPAIAVGFTSFTAQTPAADNFEFTPPEGAEVSEQQIPAPSPGHESDAKEGTAKPGISNPENHPEAIDGQGWDTVVVVPAKEAPKDLTANELLNQLATPVDGGKLLHTSLLNVLVTEDGRMVMGAVTVDRLQAAANGK